MGHTIGMTITLQITSESKDDTETTRCAQIESSLIIKARSCGYAIGKKQTKILDHTNVMKKIDRSKISPQKNKSVYLLLLF